MFSKTALDYIYERNTIFNESKPNQLVVAIFFYSGGT